jgi:PAS domain S-box-containing protein
MGEDHSPPRGRVAADLLSRLWIAWQPIWDIRTDTVVGHEALIRGPARTRWATPAQLFAWAEGVGRGEELERQCRQLAWRAAESGWPAGQRLFLNVDGRWPELPEPWEQPDAAAVPLAVEISEHHPALDNPALQSALARWRKLGHLIAIDDYGTGYAGAATVLALQPDLLKLDRRLIAGIDADTQKQSLVAALRRWTEDLGVLLLAEGVETAAELDMVRQLGCDLAQGFYLGRPRRRWIRGQPREARTPLVPVVGRPPEPALQFYAGAIADSAVASYVVDRRRCLVAWNHAAAELLGYEHAEVVGRRCFDSPFQHRDREGHRLCVGACPLVRSMATGKSGQAVVSVRLRDGSRRLIQMWVTPLFDPARGEVVGALEQFRPVADWTAGEFGASGGTEAPGC